MAPPHPRAFLMPPGNLQAPAAPNGALRESLDRQMRLQLYAANGLLDDATEVLGSTSRLASFAAQSYLVSLAVHPLHAVETLLQVQSLESAGAPPALPPPPTPPLTLIPGPLPLSPSETDMYANLWAGEGAPAAPETTVGARARTVSTHSAPRTAAPTVLPPGVLAPMSATAAARPLGWVSLYNGHLCGAVHRLLTTLLQPAVEQTLADTLGLLDDPHAAAHTASWAAVAYALSPLDTLQTRLIAQADTAAGPQRYRGTLSGLLTMYRHEGGLAGLYPGSLVLPTLLGSALTALARVQTHLLLAPVAAQLFPAAAASAAVQAVAAIVEAALVTPIDAVRRRLQVQPRGRRPTAARRRRGRPSVLLDDAASIACDDSVSVAALNAEAAPAAPPPFLTVVPTAAYDMAGFWDCLVHTVVHEGAAVVRRRQATGRPRPIAPTVAGDVWAASQASFTRLGGTSLSPSRAASERPSRMASSAASQSPRQRTASAAPPASGAPTGSWRAGAAYLYRGFWARVAATLVAVVVCELDVSASVPPL